MSLRFLRKKHKYETQADLKDMSAEQIVSLNPGDVGTYIERETGGIPLEGVKKRAMFSLLAIKKQNKQTPSESGRQRAISSFLQRESIKPDPEVTKLLVETDNQVMKEKLEQKDLENRLRKLNDQAIIPDTEDEALFRRVQSLKAGKRKRKTVSKRKRREKTKKGRKNTKKTQKRK
jgi:hypothetical protein